MTELDLYKYITHNDIEWRKVENTIYIYLFVKDIVNFFSLCTPDIFDDGLECRVKNGYFVIPMNDICEYYGIKMENVFEHK